MMPCGPLPINPSEILGSKKMGMLVDALRKKYPRIVFDSPPITAVTDSVILAKIVDGVLLVIRAGKTPRQVVHNGLAQLHAINANVMGALLNRVDMNREGYYHYQYYCYYYGEDGNKKQKKKRRFPPAEPSA